MFSVYGDPDYYTFWMLRLLPLEDGLFLVMGCVSYICVILFYSIWILAAKDEYNVNNYTLYIYACHKNKMERLIPLTLDGVMVHV